MIKIVDDPVESWFKKAEKKGPYYLLHKEPFINYQNVPGWHRYTLIWREKVKGTFKTKIAHAEDGLSLRYGFDTIAVLTGTSVTGLWQASSNLITDSQLNALLDVANGRIHLPVFDIRLLKDVEW